MEILGFVAGLVLLVAGAEWLVSGAARLSARIGISPLVIGLTVVAFGTSAPEMAVSLKAAYAGQADLALGNVVGSNIFNVLFILGLSALICPLVVSVQLIRLDVPFLILVSLATLGMALDQQLSRVEGLLLFSALLSYTGFLIRRDRKASALASVSDLPRDEVGAPVWLCVLKIVLGLALLVIGARWLVTAAVGFARHLGVSELVIGLTIVSAGTSLPEVFASVVASFRGERDIAVGNVIGSNLFNLLGVLGLTALIAPAAVVVPESVLWFDLPVMLAVALACLPVFFTGGQISRWEGALFFAYYLAYTAYLVLAAIGHEALPVYALAMGAVVLPLSGITLAVVAFQALRRRA